MNIPYRVGAFRAAGIEAKWKTSREGRPYIVCKKVTQKNWFIVTSDMYARMQEVGIIAAYDEFTATGDVFFVSCN